MTTMLLQPPISEDEVAIALESLGDEVTLQRVNSIFMLARTHLLDGSDRSEAVRHVVKAQRMSLDGVPQAFAQSVRVAPELSHYLAMPELVAGWVTPNAVVLKHNDLVFVSDFMRVGRLGVLYTRHTYEAHEDYIGTESESGMLARFKAGERYNPMLEGTAATRGVAVDDGSWMLGDFAVKPAATKEAYWSLHEQWGDAREVADESHSATQSSRATERCSALNRAITLSPFTLNDADEVIDAPDLPGQWASADMATL